jgi:alkanesulfonate monooxygenase SsuD/methylene tetrahydromethanopterin reductase-like flavin-dependent oxidoreductase (luciferase family)
MKLGLTFTTLEGALHGRTPTFRDLREMVQRAEQMGFDSCWMGDHLLYRFSSHHIHKQGADALWYNVFSSPAPRLIVPSVGSPPQV